MNRKAGFLSSRLHTMMKRDNGKRPVNGLMGRFNRKVNKSPLKTEDSKISLADFCLLEDSPTHFIEVCVLCRNVFLYL